MSHERPYQKLIVWREAHQLCLQMYELTEHFPESEKFRLINQICRAAYSVPMNIAEGSGKTSKKERFRFYEIAACSLEELHYQAFLAKDLHYITEQSFHNVDRNVRKTSYLLNKLKSSLL